MEADHDYILEGMPHLAPAVWSGVQTDSGAAPLSFIVPLDPANPRVYFRVQEATIRLRRAIQAILDCCHSGFD